MDYTIFRFFEHFLVTSTYDSLDGIPNNGQLSPPIVGSKLNIGGEITYTWVGTLVHTYICM